MRSVYTVQLSQPILLEDFWSVPFMGGQLVPIAIDGKTTGFELTFKGQPAEYAPQWDQNPQGRSKGTLTIRDKLVAFVRFQLRDAFTYLQCFFDIELEIEEIQTHFYAESPEEEAQLTLRSWKEGRHHEPLLLPYDMLTRALSAAEKKSPPHFEASLAHKARKEMLAKRYIDSFRYSFLLFEALFGDGKFKTDQLKDAFRQSAELQNAIQRAMAEGFGKSKRTGHSDTDKLLAAAPSSDAISDHLVEKRGFYFHGNVRRKDAWQPHQQQSAEALCMLALDIVLALTMDAAMPMFAPDHTKTHFKNAEKAGAIMTLRVSFTYQEPLQDFDRNNAVDIRVPATKVTEKLAVYAAQEFLKLFGDRTPNSNLRRAACVVKDSGQPVFEMVFHGSQPDDQKPANGK